MIPTAPAAPVLHRQPSVEKPCRRAKQKGVGVTGGDRGTNGHETIGPAGTIFDYNGPAPARAKTAATNALRCPRRSPSVRMINRTVSVG